MNAITTNTANSFLLNNMPFDKHYSFIVEKHFVSNINDNNFTAKHITKVSLVNHFDSNDKLLSNQLLKDISIDGTVYTSIVDFMNAFEVVKYGSALSPNTLTTTFSIEENLLFNTQLSYQVPFEGILNGSNYNIAVTGLPTSVNYNTTVTDNNSVNLFIVNTTEIEGITISNTLTLTAVKLN